MMFLVKHEDKTFHVRVEKRRGRLYVKLNEEEEERIDVSFLGNDCTLIRDNKVFYANISGHKSDYMVWRPTRHLKFHVETEYKRIVGQLKGANLENDNQISAKMPGKVTKIMKKVGDVVQSGDSVMVMEAMKMENEIRTSISGKIAKILVKEGQAVESGELLAELAPLK